MYIKFSWFKLIEGASDVGGGQEISTPNSLVRSESVCSPCDSQSGSDCVSGPIGCSIPRRDGDYSSPTPEFHLCPKSGLLPPL